MTLGSPESHHWRAKTVAAMLAATAALAGGAQALAPAPAAAVMQENEECSDSESIYLVDCQEENGGGGGGSGTDTAGADNSQSTSAATADAQGADAANEPEQQTQPTVQLPHGNELPHGNDYWDWYQRWFRDKNDICDDIAGQFERADHPSRGFVHRVLVRLHPRFFSEELTPRERHRLAARWTVENCQEIVDTAGPTSWP